MPIPTPNPSSAKVVARRGIQILIRQQDGDVERSIFMCQPDITFGELFQDIKQKRSKSYHCSAVHVTGTNVNSTSVHKDCVEDPDTLLADICFNEDLYTKPPTVEFTVTEEQVAPPRIRKAAASTVSSSSITSSSSSSNFKDSNVSSNISTNISSNSNNNSSSSSSIVSNSRNSMLDRSEFFSTSTAPISRIKMNRVAGTEPPQKIAYNSGKEIPFDHDEEKEMTVYTNGRNRKVYYGINGAPYYITDTGNRVYVTSAPQSVREQFLEIETARNAALLDLKSALDNKTSSSSSLSSGLHNSLSALSSMKRKSIMGRNIVEESLAYLSHDRPSVRSMIPLTVPVPAPPPFTRTIEDSASSSSDSDNDYVKQLKAASSSSSSSSATAPSAPAFRQTDLMQLKQPEPKRVERRADEALKEKEKEKEKEVLKMVPVAPRKPSIVMSFKSYQYRYAFECLHGKSSLLKPEANILWEKTFSKDAHQEECGAGLLDPVWGILSGNAAVFVMTPLIKSEGEERRKIMNKLDTCGLVSSTNECQVCILFRSAEYLVKDLKRLMRWNKRISETSTSTYKLQEVLDRLAALTDPDQDKEDASKEIFLVMFKKAAQVRLLKVKKEMSLKREQLADAKKREEANKEKGDEQEEGTGADHDRIDAEEDKDAEVKQKKEKVAPSPEQPKKKRSRSSSKEIVAAVEDDEEVEVVIVPYLKERNACDTILIDIPPLVLPEQPQDVEEEQEEEEASVAMSKESSASDIDSGDSSCASADESAMRRKSLSPTTSTSAALHEREGRQESTKRHRSSTGGGTGPVTSPRSKSGEEGSPAAAAVVAPPKKAGGGERKGISKSGLKKVVAEETVVSVKVERRRESEGKLRKVEGKEASSDTLPSGGTVKKKKRKLSSCSLDDADRPSDPSSSSSHISDSASSPTAVTVTAGVSFSAASSSSAPLSSTGGTSNIDSGSDLSNSNSTLFDTHPSSMSQSNSNNNNNVNNINHNNKRDDNRNYNSHAVNYNSSSSGGVGDYDRYGSYMVNTNSNTRFNNIDNNRDSRDNSYFNAPMTGVDNHCLDFNANINFDPHGYSNLMGGVMSVNPNSIQQGNSGIGNFRLNNVNNIHMGNNSIRNVNNVNSNANSGMINNSMIMGSGINSSMNSNMGNMNTGIPNGLYNNVAYSGIANNNNNNSSDYSSKVNTHNPNIDYYNYDFAPNDPSYQYLHPIEHNCSTYDNLLYTYDIKTSRNVVDEKMYRSDKVIFRDISNGRETRTTLMARGISVKYQLSELWQDLHSQLRNKFDFINCPPRPGVLGENMGYFVINLRSPKHIHAFVQGFLQMKLFPSSMLNDNQESHRAVSFCTFQRTARTAEEREVPKAPPRPPPPPPPPLPLYDPPIAATPTNKDKKRLKMAEYHDKKKKERMDRKERRNSLASENDTEGKRADGTYEDEEEYNEEVDSDSNSPPLSSHTKDPKNDPPSKLKSISSSSMKVIDRDAPSVLSASTASTPFQSPSAAAYLPQPSSSATAAVKASKHVIFEESIEIEPMKEVKPKKKRVEAVKTSSKKDLAKEEEEEEEEEEAAPATRIVKDKGKEKEKVKEKKEKVKVEEEDDEEDKEKEKEKEKTSKKSKAKQSERADGVISDLSKRERESSKKELAASSSLPDPGSDSVPSSELPLPEDSVKQKKRPKDTARASEAVDTSTAKPSKRKLIEVADIPLTKYVNEESESDQITTRGREAEGDADINNIVSPRRKRVKESVVLTEGKGDGDGDGSRDLSGTVEGASAACVVDMTAIPADGEGLLKRVRGGKGRGKDAITGAPAAASSFNAIVVGKRGEIRRDTRKPVSKEAVPALPKQPPLKITVDRRPRADAPNCEEAAVKETGKDKVKQKMKDKVEKVKPAVEESGGERDAEARDREKEKEKEKKLTSEPPQEQKEQGKSKAESKTVKKEAADSVIDAEKDKGFVREKKADRKQDALGDAGERKGLGDNKEASNEGENAGKTSSGNKSEDGKKAAAVETEKDRKGREGVSEEKCPDWGMSDILSAIEKRERRASLGAGSEITEKKEKRRDSDGAREHTASLQRDRDRDISKGKAIPPQPLVHETMPTTESKSKFQPDSNTRNRSQGMQEGGVKSEGKDRDNSTSRPSEGPRSGFSTDFTFEDSDMPSKPPCTPTVEGAATATHTASDYHSKDRDREGERDRGSTSVRAGQDTVSGSRRRSTSTTGGPLEQTENIVRNLSNTTSNANMQDAYSRGKSEGSTSTSSEAKKIKSEGNMSGSKVSSSTSKNASNSTNRPRADSSSGYRGRDRDCSSGSKSATAHSSGASNRSQNHSSGDVIQSVKAEMMSGSNSHSRTQSLKKELFKPLTRDGWAASGPQSTPLAPTPGGTQHGWVQSMVTGTWGVDGPVGGASGNSATTAPQVPIADPSALTSNPPKPFPPQPFDPKELVYPVESTHTHF